MINSYDYMHAYVRGLKSLLLKLNDYEQLLAAADISEMIKVLKNTKYEGSLVKVPPAAEATNFLETALWSDLQSDVEKISKTLPSKSNWLLKLLLNQWDLHNLKTVLRGKQANLEKSEIEQNLILGGSISLSILKGLINQPDVKGVIDLMSTWQIHWSKPLTRNFPQYYQTKNLVLLEYALDKYYFSYALEKLNIKSFNAALVKEIILREIDLTNILTLLRLARDGQVDKAFNFFIPGGKDVEEKTFASLAKARTVAELVEKLKDVSCFKKVKLDLSANLPVSKIERALEKNHLARVKRLFLAEPFSLAVTIAYLWSKMAEIINIRLIMRAKEVKLPVKQIREELALG